MPIDALYNAIRNAPNQQGWQAAQQREAASHQAAIDEAVAREQAAQQAAQLWNGYDYNAEAERRAQVGGFDASKATQQVDPLVQAMYYAQQNNPNVRWQGDPQQMGQQYAMLPGTQTPVNSERGQAITNINAQESAARTVRDAVNPFDFSNTPRGMMATPDRIKAYNEASDVINGADAARERIMGYNTDEEYRAAQAAQRKAGEDRLRQSALDTTQAAVQLDELRQRKAALEEQLAPVRAARNLGGGEVVSASGNSAYWERVQNELDRVDEAIRQYETDIAAADKYRRLESYNRVAYAQDFAANNKYRKTYGDDDVKQYGLAGENKLIDIDENAKLYEIINGNGEIRAERLQTLQNAGGGGLGGAATAAIVNAQDPLQVAKYMSNREKETFNYLYNTQGGEAARDYYELLVADLNARYTAAEAQRWDKEAKASPVGASITSIAAAPMRGLSLVGQVADVLANDSVDQNDPYNTFVRTPTAIRTSISKDLERKYGKGEAEIYNTIMNTADNVYLALLSGVYTAGAGAASSVAAKAMANEATNVLLGIMSTGAAADAVISAKERGLSGEQAVAFGLICGTIEALTEKVGMDAFVDALYGGKGALAALAKSVLAEGLEEGVGDFLTAAADVAVNNADAEYIQRMRQLRLQGMSESQAASQAFGELLKEAGADTLRGAASALLMTGSAQVVTNSYNAARNSAPSANIFSQQYNENALNEAYLNPDEGRQWQYGSDILAEQERQERRARAEERRNARTAQTAAVPSETPANPAVSTPTAPQTANDTAEPTRTETPIQNGENGDVLWTHPSDNSGWKEQYNGDNPTYDALRLVDPEMFEAFLAEGVEGNTNTPIINAYVSAYNDVRQGTISPMAAATLLSDAYNEGGPAALAALYNPSTGNLISSALETAKQIDARHDAPAHGNTEQTAPSQTNAVRSSQGGEVQASVDADRTSWENWKAERAEGNTAEAKPLSALIEEMRTFFGLHVGVGNVRTPRANATYNTRDHDIRTRIANNVPSISHELGHHIDQLHGITRNASAEVKADLDAAYSREFADDTYAKSEHASEGLAQFVKYYLTNKEQAVADFPDLANAFLSSLTEQERNFINNFADEVNAYMSTPTEDRPSSVVLPGEKNDTRSTREKVSQATDRFIQNWTDRFHGIKRAEAKLGGDGTVYQTVQGLPYARNVADYCLTKEMTNLNGQRVGGSLVSALEGINVENKAEFRAFGDYLVAKHLPERLAQGKRVYADEQRNNIEAAQRQIAQLDAKYPQFKAAAERVVEYERQLVKTFGVDAGLVSADTFKRWQEIYPNHVPLNRVMDETGSYGAKRGGEVDSAFKMTAKDGSGRDIVHPVMNIINETVSLVQLAKENQVRLGLRELAMGQDANAAVMTKVNPMKAETVRADELKDAVRKTAKTLAGIVDESNIDRLLDELQDYTIFRKGKGGGNVVPVMVNGKSETWQINDPLLLDSLNNMRPQKMSTVLETYGKISRFITQNITGGDIVWSISRNMPKDQINLLMLMKDKKQLLNVIKNEGVSWVNSFLEARGKTEQMNPFVREFYAMGGGRGQSALTQGSDFTRSTARALTGQNKSARGIAEKILTSPMDLVGFVSDTIETGPRCATYVAYRQNGYSPQRAFYEAMDSTTNFAMQGKLGREVNKVVPFFSAGIAGVNRMVRYLSAEDVAGQGKEARKRAVAARVTTYAVTSFLLTAIQFALNHATKKRKEEYQQVSNYIKNTNWLIPYGDGKFVAIQKSRETNLLSSFFDALLERTIGGDEHAFDEFYGYAVDQVFPGVASDLAKLPENIAKDGFGQGIEDSFFSALGSMGLIGVVANLGANKDFRGRPIVSQTYENLPQREQYNASTSKLAYWIGQAFNISPMKLDYFGKNVLGYMWKYPAQVFPMDPSKRDFSLGVKGTYTKDNVYSNDIANRLYDRADASALAAASYSAGPEQKYYKAKDERMTTFYSRFNKLNRDDGSDSARDDRAEMMDFLAAYLAGAEMGEETKAEQFIREACVENEDTKYLPSALPTTIKNGKDEIQLTASQYYYYQTRYMELYYSKVASRGSLNMNAKQKAEICSAASQEAKEQAAKETLRRR